MLAERYPFASDVLDELWVHYAASPAFKTAERTMLNAFAGAVSPESRAALHDPERMAPFANLRTGEELIKRHGISGATGNLNATTHQKRPSASAAGGTVRRAVTVHAAAERRVPGALLLASGRNLSPSQTARRDVSASPRPAKRLFPPERARLEVIVRNTPLRPGGSPYGFRRWWWR